LFFLFFQAFLVELDLGLEHGEVEDIGVNLHRRPVCQEEGMRVLPMVFDE
jgi:hypothetical protein